MRLRPRPAPASSRRLRPAPLSVLFLVLSAIAFAASGCSLFDREVDLEVDGVEARWVDQERIGGREALVVTPLAEPPEGGWPLVVMLHGLGSDPEFTARLTGWAEASARHGLVAVFPRGEEMSWNAGPCCGSSAADGTDDVAFVRRVIEKSVDDLPVDAARVYLAGYSNGAMLTYRFLCSDAQLLAGAASVAGTNTAGCPPSQPVRFLQISGADDDVVPLGGGQSSQPGLGTFPSVRDSVAGIAAAEGCIGERSLAEGVAMTTTWAPCAQDVTVELDVVQGLDHGWFLPDVYLTTERILRFWGLIRVG